MDRKVYSIPCRMFIECKLFLLGKDITDIRRLLRYVDLNDYYGLTPKAITTDSIGLLKFEDVITVAFDADTVEVTEATDYPPNQHPDFVGVPEK
jgi:hypothetical protein